MVNIISAGLFSTFVRQSWNSSLASSVEFASFRATFVILNWLVVLVILFLHEIPKYVTMRTFTVFRTTGRTSAKNPFTDGILTLQMFGFWFLAWAVASDWELRGHRHIDLHIKACIWHAKHWVCRKGVGTGFDEDGTGDGNSPESTLLSSADKWDTAPTA